MNTPTVGVASISTSSRQAVVEPETAVSSEERILAQVYSQLGPERYARFFDRQARLTLAPGHLDVTVPTGFAAQLLDRKFGDLLRRAARATVGRDNRASSGSEDRAPMELRFRVDSAAFGRGQRDSRVRTAPAPSGPVRVAQSDPARRSVTDKEPAGRFRLDNFVVGEANRLAFSAAEEVCRADGERRISPLFIHGRCGVGKTHLLHGIASRWRDRAGAVVRFTTAEAFTNEFITAVKANRIEPFRKGYRGVDVLCIDDVHFLSAKTGTQSELLHTFDALDLGGARVVMASDEHPRAIQRLGDSLASRFMSGMVVRLDDPEPALRERIARALATARGLAIDDGAARLIAAWPCQGSGGGGSVRDLEGLVTRVQAVMRLVGPAGGEAAVIDIHSARRALGLGGGSERPAPLRPRRPIRVEVIAAEVCRSLGVEYGDVCGRGRHARVVVARSLTAYLSRRLTTMSFPEIARAMGRPNHSSVITAYRRVEAQIAAGVELGPAHGGMSLGDMASQLEDRLVRGATPA